MGAQEVEQFLTYLPVNGRVASSIQNQALSAILFMYKEVLKIELPWLNDVTRAKRCYQPRRFVGLNRQINTKIELCRIVHHRNR